jgi:hypothetical protein
MATTVVDHLAAQPYDDLYSGITIGSKLFDVVSWRARIGTQWQGLLEIVTTRVSFRSTISSCATTYAATCRFPRGHAQCAIAATDKFSSAFVTLPWNTEVSVGLAVNNFRFGPIIIANRGDMLTCASLGVNGFILGATKLSNVAASLFAAWENMRLRTIIAKTSFAVSSDTAVQCTVEFSDDSAQYRLCFQNPQGRLSMIGERGGRLGISVTAFLSTVYAATVGIDTRNRWSIHFVRT